VTTCQEFDAGSAQLMNVGAIAGNDEGLLERQRWSGMID
jgi:hypothetical protein